MQAALPRYALKAFLEAESKSTLWKSETIVYSRVSNVLLEWLPVHVVKI